MSDVRQLPGPEMAAMMKRGTRVKRGVDWRYGYQDGQGLGTVKKMRNKDGRIWVQWENGYADWYRMGKEGKYELQLAEP